MRPSLPPHVPPTTSGCRAVPRVSAAFLTGPALALGTLVAVIGSGCAGESTSLRLPEARNLDGERALAFEVRRDGGPAFWQYQQADGRTHAIAYALPDTSAPGPRIDLDAIPPSECPHLLIVLDGVPFELVEELRQEGRFRLFHPPARVICCYPAMTDLALSELFGTGPCLGFQALFYDRRANRMSDGNAVYLSGRNSPWLAEMDYRCSLWWDAKVYLDPQAVFRHELAGILRTLQPVQQGEVRAYSVGTAGLGTRGGRPAILRYLAELDDLCERLVYERQGRIKITLTADHGHNLVENRRVSFSRLLRDGGYRPARSLRGPRDVVTVSYGLVTYADFATHDPAGVAQCLLHHEDAEFACYPAAGALLVRSRAGEARITRTTRGFTYEATSGDPLLLAPVIERLRAAGKVSAAGEIDEDALFHATVDHVYPDPLARLWGAFHEVAENPPDLIVNLRDGACHGSAFFHAMLGTVVSTHGSLNRLNSTTFAMTMLGELPPALRTREVLPALDRLRAGR